MRKKKRVEIEVNAFFISCFTSEEPGHRVVKALKHIVGW